MIESTEKLLKITGVFYSPADNIEWIAEDQESATVSFFTPNDWEEIKFTEATYEEPESDSADGDVYKQTLKVVIAGDYSNLQELLITLKTCKPVFIFEYDNGDQKLIGTKRNYCKVGIDFESSDFVTKRMLKITRMSHRPALFLI
jgi:hypothetical protein